MDLLVASLLAVVAHAHPSVDGHLHAVEVRCTTADGAPVADPMVGTIAAIRRAGVLSDVGRTDDALAELNAACLPDAEVVRLARARTLLHGERPDEALAAIDGLSGPDAALWRAQALVDLGRAKEAGALLAASLHDLPSAPPETYLEAAELTAPCTAVPLLELGLQRRGDVATLRRAAAAADWACDPTGDAPLERLRPNDVRDQLLAGDLLAAAGRPVEARRRWSTALEQVASQRDTPARRAMSKTLFERLITTDSP